MKNFEQKTGLSGLQQKKTEVSLWHPTQYTYIPSPPFAVTHENELGIYVHCVGGPSLVSGLFVTVLIALYVLLHKVFYYF